MLIIFRVRGLDLLSILLITGYNIKGYYIYITSKILLSLLGNKKHLI
jgi:hypothetical protein